MKNARENAVECITFAILSAVVVAVFARAFFYDFVYDDLWTIVKNPAIKNVFPVLRFFLDGSTSALPSSGISLDVYRPLSTLSFALNNAMTGLRPGGFRLVGIVLHAINGLLLWELLKREIGPSKALFAALLFLVHPAQVESVVWITQRSVLLCGCGCLLALIGWQRAEKDPRLAWASCAFFFFALLAKETALLLLVLFLFQLKNRQDARLPALVACVPLAAAYLFIRRSVLGVWGQPVHRVEPIWVSLSDGMTALAHYGKIIFWPNGLNVSYRAPESLGMGSPDLWIGLFLLTAVLCGAFYFFRRKPMVSFGLLTFLIFWFPHSGVTPLVTFAADRFLYLPMMGLSIALVCAWPESRTASALLLGLAAGCAVVSFRRVADWKDEKTLWAASVREDGKNPFALACLGQSLQREGDNAGAIRYYVQALSSRPTVSLARTLIPVLIALYEHQGDSASAVVWREKFRTVPR